MHKHFLFYLHFQNQLYTKYILAYNLENSHDSDFKYFFENVNTGNYNEIKTHYQVKCDGCLSFPIKTYRWKCCNCIGKNICDTCKTRIETRAEGYYEKILWNVQHVGCDPIHHVFRKIIFDCFVY